MKSTNVMRYTDVLLLFLAVFKIAQTFPVKDQETKNNDSDFQIRMAESETAFENSDSRYDNWAVLKSDDKCASNISVCTVILKTLNGVIVRNFDEQNKAVHHIVADKKFRCHGTINSYTRDCMFSKTRFGQYRIINENCLNVFALEDNCEFVPLTCPRSPVATSTVSFSGRCIIKVDKSLNMKVNLETKETDDVCFDIFINDELTHTGTTNFQSPITVSLPVDFSPFNLRVQCGSSELIGIYVLGRYPRCIKWLSSMPLPYNALETICEYFFFFRIAIIAILVTAIFSMIHKIGAQILLVPIYLLLVSPIILLQKLCKRRKICKICGSQKYYAIPHWSECSLKCTRCKTFSGKNFEEAYEHKLLCENAHVKYTATDMIRYMLAEKTIVRILYIITTCIFIWLISELHVAEATPKDSFSSMNFAGATLNVQGVRGGDIVNLPPGYNSQINIFGGTGMLEVDSTGLKSLLKTTADTLEGNIQEPPIEKQTPEQLTKRIEAALEISRQKVSEGLTGAKKEMAAIVNNINEEMINIQKDAIERDEKQNKTIFEIEKKIRLLDKKLQDAQKHYNTIYSEFQKNQNDRELYKSLVQSYQEMQKFKEMKRQFENSAQTIRTPNRNKSNSAKRKRRHIAELTAQNSFKTTMSETEFFNLHELYTHARENPKLASFYPIDPTYSTRVFQTSNCIANDVWIDTVQQGDNQNLINLKIFATFALTPQSCSIFDIKFKDETIAPTKLVIKVTQTSIRWPLTYLYSSYRTSSITAIPHELCLEGDGECMRQIKNIHKDMIAKGAVLKAWDKCQTTGCEYFGCAVVSGGSCCLVCKDVPDYESEIKVYTVGSPIFQAELCIQIPGHKECLQVKSVAGQPTNDFSFNNVFSVLMSDFKRDMRVAIPTKTKAILSGAICDIADYCSGFGSLQYVNSSQHGEPDIEAYYFCNGIAYHTYQVHRCFKNTHAKHQNLKHHPSTKSTPITAGDEDYIYEKDVYLGSMTWTAHLTNVIISRKDQHVKLDLTLAGCKGCYRCLQHAQCLVSSDSSASITGTVYCDDVSVSTNIIGVEPGQTKFRFVIDTKKKSPDLDCHLITPIGTFDIKKTEMVVLEKGNVTWDDDPINPAHIDPKDTGSIMFKWSWFNPFSSLGWNSWFAVFKVLILGLILGAVCIGLIIVVKYFKIIFYFFNELANLIKFSNSKITHTKRNIKTNIRKYM